MWYFSPTATSAATGRNWAVALCGIATRVSAARILISIGSRVSALGKFSDAPTVVAAVQAAHIHPSTAGRRSVKLAKQVAHAIRKGANDVSQVRFHAVSAV